MRRSIIVLLFTLTFFDGCRSQKFPTSAEFNSEARIYFTENFNVFDLSPLDDVEKCILKKVVSNDLNEINGSRMVILQDKFLIKNYYEGYLQLHFSFVKILGNGKMYFIFLPQLSEFMFDVKVNYERKNDSVFTLAAPREPIKINTFILEKFFMNTEFLTQSNHHDVAAKFKFASEVLNEAFPFLIGNEISNADLRFKLKNDLKVGIISHDSFKKTIDIIDQSLSKQDYQVKVYHLERIGYLVQVYSVDRQSSGVAVNLFFLADAERPLVSRLQTIKYRECREAN